MEVTSLFNPLLYSCPICNNQARLFRHSYEKMSDGARRCPIHPQHVFTFYEAMKAEMGGPKTVEVFARNATIKNIDTRTGHAITVPLNNPEGLTPYASQLEFWAEAGSPPAVVLPVRALEGEDPIVVSLAVLNDGDLEPVQIKGNLQVRVWMYDRKTARGWTRLFYDCLNDLNDKRLDLAVFKLATSIELFADDLLERYLVMKTVNGSLADRVIASARNWPERLTRVRTVVDELLTPEDRMILKEAASPFQAKVRDPRNTFAHEQGVELTYDEASEAFKAAFDVLWVFDRCDAALPR